jgi:FkbM family methyltransferase
VNKAVEPLVKRFISQLVNRTPLGLWPVRVRAGLAVGARWTLAPFSSNWRTGGEQDVAAAFRLLSHPRRAVCWDVGAHFGIHTVGLARHVGDEGQVCAFEPDEVAFKRLESHVQMNRLSNVRLFMAAATNFDGTLEMVPSGGLGSTVTHVRYCDEAINESTVSVSVRAVKLDSLVFAGKIGAPDFIKVDIEGHGGEALEGAMRAIASRRPIISLSVHSAEEWRRVGAVLSRLGYVGRRLAGDSCPWDKFPGLATVLLQYRQ